MPARRTKSSRNRPVSATRTRAKVFWTGRSQAVRLPKEMRFSTSEVTVHRDGTRVILEPLQIKRDPKGWPLAFWSLEGAAPDFTVGDRAAPHERADLFRSKD